MRQPGNLQYRYIDLFFTTATVKDWNHLFRPDKYKQIIVDALAHLTRDQSVRIYAFVIMPNHFHLVWQLTNDQPLGHTQLRLLKFVAQQIKFDLIKHHPKVLEQFKAKRKDRQYQFFKVRPLSIPILTEKVAIQKIGYIHRNPVHAKWNLAAYPENYYWSSAGFYTSGVKDWPFLTHFFYDGDWPPLEDAEL